jgi:hypothetical protein
MGTVYILSNPSMPGLLKIGWTDRNPADRVAELSASTGVPTAFVLEFHTSLDDAQSAERKIHMRFGEQRVNGSREFFSVSLTEVVAELKQLRLAQVLDTVEGLEKEFHPYILAHLLRQDPSLLDDPVLQPGRLDAAIASLLQWDDQSLMKVIDALLSKRSALRATFYLK